MKLRWSLIGAITVLSVALTFVLLGIARGGGQAPAAARPTASASATASATAGAVRRITEPRQGEQARYVGVSEDGSFALAVVVWADKVIAYVCDGAAREAWLSGTLTGGEMALEGDNGAALHATEADGVLTGTARQGQWSVTFAVHRTQAPAGVYRAGGTAGGSQVGYGIIVLPDGRQTGIGWTDGQPQPAPAFDLGTATLTDKGVTLTVDPIESDQL